MGNKNLVITIEREYGSGGRIVGRRLAEELGIHFYDDEILKLTSEKSAIGEEYFRLADEKAGNNLLHRIVGRKLDFTEDPVLSGNVTAPENLFRFQSSVIRELAREESCIIVGRAAGYVLDQEEDLERLLLWCVQRQNVLTQPLRTADLLFRPVCYRWNQQEGGETDV